MILSALAGLTLAAAGARLDCRPEYPVFCRNMHVGCAGRSAAPAPAFSVTLGAKEGLLATAGEATRVTVSRSHSGTVLRPESGDWWIRIDPGGQFSHRVTTPSGALMSIGICTPGS